MRASNFIFQQNHDDGDDDDGDDDDGDDDDDDRKSVEGSNFICQPNQICSRGRKTNRDSDSYPSVHSIKRLLTTNHIFPTEGEGTNISRFLYV